jgi:hypothetical protein
MIKIDWFATLLDIWKEGMEKEISQTLTTNRKQGKIDQLRADNIYKAGEIW